MLPPYNVSTYDAKHLLDSCEFQHTIKYNYGDQDTAAAHVVGFRDISLWNDEESLRCLNLKKIGGNYCEAFDSIHNRGFQGNVRGVEKGSDWVLERSAA